MKPVAKLIYINLKIDLYKFENYVVTGLNLYYPNVLIKTENNLVLPTVERTMRLNQELYMKFNYIKKESTHVCDTPLFFFMYNKDKHFHFLYDSLPYLSSYLHLKTEIPDLKLLN
jgi:hypothetical protein